MLNAGFVSPVRGRRLPQTSPRSVPCSSSLFVPRRWPVTTKRRYHGGERPTTVDGARGGDGSTDSPLSWTRRGPFSRTWRATLRLPRSNSAPHSSRSPTCAIYGKDNSAPEQSKVRCRASHSRFTAHSSQNAAPRLRGICSWSNCEPGAGRVCVDRHEPLHGLRRDHGRSLPQTGKGVLLVRERGGKPGRGSGGFVWRGRRSGQWSAPVERASMITVAVFKNTQL